MREARFGTAQAGVVGAGFTGGAIPEDTITAGTRHGAPATYLIEQTSTSLTKITFYFIRKSIGIGAASLHKIGEESLGAVVFVQ